MATTNPSQSALATAQKYANPSNFVSAGGGDFGGGGAGGSWDDGPTKLLSGNSDAGGGRSSSAFSAIDPRRLDLKVPPGAEQLIPPPSKVEVYSMNDGKMSDDLRVKIRIPPWYFTNLTSGFKSPNGGPGELEELGAIIFPYTPTISFENKADYSSPNLLHSNFAIQFYQKSSVSQISISGKFTVENLADAQTYLSTVTLLKALTKMKFGTDPDAGSPPPVCRLDAYGDMMLKNIPVAISSFRTELTDDVDYFVIPGNGSYGKNSVPTRSTIQVTCIPMYSRQELQQFSVANYINSNNSRGFI